MRFRIAPAVIALFLSTSAEAQSGLVGSSGCLADYLGFTHCSPPMGTVLQHSQIEMIVCGRGQCAENAMGQVACAAQPGGAVVIQPTGFLQCVGGCETPRTEYCQTPR